MTSEPALPLVLSSLPPRFVLRNGPIELETHRGRTGTSVRIPGTNTMGMGDTDEDAMVHLLFNVRWWFLHDGPRIDSGQFPSPQDRRQRPDWEAIQALISYEPPDP